MSSPKQGFAACTCLPWQRNGTQAGGAPVTVRYRDGRAAGGRAAAQRCRRSAAARLFTEPPGRLALLEPAVSAPAGQGRPPALSLALHAPNHWLTPCLRMLLLRLRGGGISQEIMEAMMAGLADKSRSVGGVPTSLIELGYDRIGMDDNWQACGAGINGSFHDAKGVPLCESSRYRSLYTSLPTQAPSRRCEQSPSPCASSWAVL